MHLPAKKTNRRGEATERRAKPVTLPDAPTRLRAKPVNLPDAPKAELRTPRCSPNGDLMDLSRLDVHRNRPTAR
jgi:hypothetical protein